MEKLLEVEKNLSRWFPAHEYKGNDPYQIDEKASWLIARLPFLRHLRKILKPFHVFIPEAAFLGFPHIYHPKAIGLIIGGNSFLYSISKDDILLSENRNLLSLLKQLRNNEYKHYAWGSPFEWGSKPRYPANTPAVCLIIPIANALLDFYDVSGNIEALDMCNDVASYITDENGFQEIDENKICLHYSPVDRNEVYNSNAMASAFLFRLNSIRGNDCRKEMAKKICRFVLEAQSPDGSWVYSTSSDIIDNRHTGFILEALSLIKDYWDNDQIKNVLANGIKFYYKNLTDNNLPKWSIDSTYPVDIHDVAQAILTFTSLGDIERAKRIADFAIEKMSNGKDEFYFKYFKNGKVNRNVFLRWGQAWMYFAIGKLLYSNKNQF